MRTANILIALIFSGLLLSAGGHVLAHEGHAMSSVIADAQDVSVTGTQVTLTVKLQGLEGHLPDLVDVFAHDLAQASFQQLAIGARDQGTYLMHLAFSTPVPGIFTAVLDFGEAGQTPLLVIP